MPSQPSAKKRPQARSSTLIYILLLPFLAAILAYLLTTTRLVPRLPALAAAVAYYYPSSPSSSSASPSWSSSSTLFRPSLTSPNNPIRPTTTSSSFTTTNATMSYAKELEIANLAVQRASILTKRVFHEKAKGTVSKDDASPVTIGDFGAQALIISAIKANFPDDEIVAEEEAAELRDNKALSQTIWDLVKAAKLDDEAAEAKIGGGIPDEETMLTMIDYGNSKGGASGRIWAIDPIDGTKGFLRGGQYAVCLGLMVDGDVKVGVLGCPNLPQDDKAPLTQGMESGQDDAGKGMLFSAVLGEGAVGRVLTAGALGASTPISMRPLTDMSAASFCESVEAGHSAHGDQADIAKKLGITNPSVRMDSQCKYASIARGAGDIYLRLPVKATYQEKIWDHAAGDLIVREAGGAVTDINGDRLNFAVGRTLAKNKGVVAAPAGGHAQVLAVVQDVLFNKPKA